MDYRVLGPLEVVIDGREIHIPGLKERALLGLLIVEAGTAVSSDRIAYELWRDDAPNDAASALRTHVSRLRKVLGPDHDIVTRRPGYVLDTDVTNIDIVRFERLADKAAKRRNHPEEVSEHARVAVDMWRGPALTDLETFEFAATEARRLEQRRLTTIARAIEAELSMGQHEGVIPELNALTVMHPYNEVFWSHLMIALYRNGRAGEALQAYRRASTALGEGLGIGPSASLRSLETAIVLEDDSLSSPGDTPNNLEHTVSTFVGRVGELEALTETMQRSRVVTLTGVGGSGKSRLAIEAAHRLLKWFTDGVWKVELAPVRDPSAVAQVVATALGEPASHASDPIQSLIDYIADRRVLVILDNCEHLLDSTATTVTRLTESCPRLSVMATSRESLHVTGETVWLVSPLDVPDPGAPSAEQEEAEAFQLFVTRAEAADTRFEVTDENRYAICQVCKDLGGLPLALELAAARSATFTPAQLHQRLQEGIEVLETPRGGALERSRTMRSSLEWSFRLLDPDQAVAFARLAVFRGGWTMEDAVEIVGVRGEQTDILLGELVEKSLVVRELGHGDRYRFLEPVREYAKEIFLRSNDAGDTRARHAARFLEVALEANSHLRGHDQRAWLDRLEADHDNLRKAIEWTLDSGAIDTSLELVAACGWFWLMNGHWQESWERLTKVLDAAGDAVPALRAKAIYTTGALQLIRVNLVPALPLVQDALEICRDVGDTYGEAWCLHLIGHTWVYGADTDPDLMKQARELFTELDRPWEVAWCDRYIGDAMGIEGDPAGGIEMQLRSISAFREMGDLWSTAFGLHNVAGLIEIVGDRGLAAAVPYYERCLRVAEGIGDRVWAAHGVRGLSGCAYRLGQDNAEELLSDAIDRLRQIGDENCLSTALGFLGELQRDDRPAQSAANTASALRIRHGLESSIGVAINLVRLAFLAHSLGRLDDAAYLATAADPIARGWGNRVPPWYKEQHRKLVDLVAPLDVSVEVEEGVRWALEWADMIAHGTESSM